MGSRASGRCFGGRVGCDAEAVVAEVSLFFFGVMTLGLGEVGGKI